MTAKPSVSLTDDQFAYARSLVESGRFPSISAVLQHGLEALRAGEEAVEAEQAALRTLIERRRAGHFLTMEESQARIAALVTAKRRAHGAG